MPGNYSNIANTWQSQILQRFFVPSFIARLSLDIFSRRRKREWRLSSHERNRLRGNSFAVSLEDFMVHNELTFFRVLCTQAFEFSRLEMESKRNEIQS